MNSVVWSAVVSANYTIPFDYQEAHPAYTEGYYSYKPFSRWTNPYEEETDSWYEYEDGLMQAYHNSLNVGTW